MCVPKPCVSTFERCLLCCVPVARVSNLLGICTQTHTHTFFPLQGRASAWMSACAAR